MVKTNAFPIAVATILLITPLPSSAWNLICGVSIGVFGASPAMAKVKWQADSDAIKAMSEFYAAIAELQAINIDVILKPGDPERAGEIAKTRNALARFKASRDQLTAAQKMASELITPANPLDSIGKESIGLWKQLAEFNGEFINNLESGSLPNLYRLHDAIDVTQRMNTLGMRASLMHLYQHKAQHSIGGATAKFQ